MTCRTPKHNLEQINVAKFSSGYPQTSIPHSIVVRTPGFHPGDLGSIPSEGEFCLMRLQAEGIVAKVKKTDNSIEAVWSSGMIPA